MLWKIARNLCILIENETKKKSGEPVNSNLVKTQKEWSKAYNIHITQVNFESGAKDMSINEETGHKQTISTGEGEMRVPLIAWNMNYCDQKFITILSDSRLLPIQILIHYILPFQSTLVVKLIIQYIVFNFIFDALNLFLNIVHS